MPFGTWVVRQRLRTASASLTLRRRSLSTSHFGGGRHEQGRSDPDQRGRPHRRAGRHVRRARSRQVQGPRPAGRHRTRRHPAVVLRRGPRTEHGPQRRRRQAPRDVQRRRLTLRRDAAGLLQRRRADPRHERRRPAGGPELPELHRLFGPGAQPGARPRGQPGDDQGLQRLARRRVVRGVSGSVHPLRHPAAVRRDRSRQGGQTARRQGLPRRDVLGESRGVADAQHPHQILVPAVRGRLRKQDGAVHPCRLGVAVPDGVDATPRPAS